MKAQLLAVCMGLLVTWCARGAIAYSATGGLIPDGNPAGWSATATLSDYLPSITSVSVSLEISGGFNGDLYAYLSHEGVLVPLLNRPGLGSSHPGSSAFGYGDAGFSSTFTLSSTAGDDVHWYRDSVNPDGGRLSGTWQPDGRTISPLAAPADMQSAGRVGFGSFNTLNPNGEWTLYLADLSAGSQSQLVSWNLSVISQVPEAVEASLGIFAGICLVFTFARSGAIRSRIQRVHKAINAWIDAV